MEQKSDVNNRFQLIEGEDDILLIDKDTFTVARFKEFLKQDFATKSSAINLGSNLSTLLYGQVRMSLAEFKWHSSLLDCQFLKVGSKGWKKGKVRSQVSLFPDDIIEVCLEFLPDEPPQPESPLDDLRELPEYKQQF